MEAIEALRIRRSIRVFQDKPLTKEILEAIIDVARFAPTARNEQPWELVVVTNMQTIKKIAELTDHGKFISQATTCIAVFCSDTKYYLEDGCAITMNILLAATALGVGSCWVAGDKKPYCSQIAELLNVPSSYKLVTLIPLGYPKDKNSFKIIDKRKVEGITHWETF
jgi:nitroreductase